MTLEELRNLQKQIRQTGSLPGGQAYLDLARRLRRNGSIGTADSPHTEVGSPPAEFDQPGFTWNRADEQIHLAMFINAAHPLGVFIDGVQAWDRIQVTSCAGIASFTEDTGNPLASSIVGLVGTGLTFLYPTAAPLIQAAESFAQDQFKATHAKHKVRDAFGVDPGSGHKAKEEGGVLVMLPEASGTRYSGDSDTKSRWIKEPGDRVDANLPDHVKGVGFFPIAGDAAHNSQTLRGSGQIFVVPWDWFFEDNAGYYRVFMTITKGTPPTPERIG